MGKWYFVADGDPQVGSETDSDGLPIVRKVKQNMGSRLIKYEKPIKFVICAGDLTSLGQDGKKILCWKNGEYNQVGIFLNDYLNNIESKGIRVYCCPGNHDTYVAWPYWYKPVFNFLRRKYNANNDGCYMFEMSGVKFISLGIYPNKKNLDWLKDQIRDLFKGTPLIIFYHYNTVDSEPYSDWWKDEEKEAFYQVIKDYNVQLIINGHYHASGKGMWHGIPVVRGSGHKSCIIEMNDYSLENIYFKEL